MSRSTTLLACVLLLFTMAAARADDTTEARAVIDSAIEAAGGREALAKYDKQFVIEGKIKSFNPRGVGREVLSIIASAIAPQAGNDKITGVAPAGHDCSTAGRYVAHNPVADGGDRLTNKRWGR